MSNKRSKYVNDKKVIDFLSKRIRELRKEKNLTQEDLVDKAEIAIAQLKRIERGTVNTSVSSVYRIATALNITVTELFEGI